MKDKRIKNSYFAARGYVVFFIITAFIVTICLNVFVITLQESLGHKFTDSEISRAASLTFITVLMVSALMTLFDYISFIYRIKKPVKNILDFTDDLSAGHFGMKLAENRGLSFSEFDIIIHNLNRLSKELAGMASLRSDYIANVSHEMKTPVAVIQNYAQLLKMEGISEEKKKEYSDAILFTSRRLAGMVSDILRLDKLEKQEIFRTDTRFSLSEELAECVIGFESRLEEKGITLEADIDEDVFISSDRELMDIVWNNLLSNAVKFTPEGGSVKVSLKTDGDRCIVRVIDSGAGIRADDIYHIFEKFYQGESGHKSEGNGLGLALVKRIIDILGAEIEVTSEVGKGSEFRVVLTF